MAIQDWSDSIAAVELADDPQFTEDLNAMLDSLARKRRDVVLNFASVGFMNSSNVACLLRLRKQVLSQQGRLKLCGVNAQVWGVFLVTGLDKVFEFTNDISTALASLQIKEKK